MRNAGNTFQRLMDRVLAGVECAFPYLDDIFIFSKGEEEHRTHLALVLRRLQEAGLAANAEKYEFGKPELDFLGHRVTASGIEPLPGWVQAISDHPAPTNFKELQDFLGVMNFYRRFVPGAARLHRPLTEALKGSPRPKAPVEWTAEMRTAFQAAKDPLQSAPGPAFPRPQAELALMVDASVEHLGAALQQRTSPTAPWEPLGFFSKKLDPAQVHYSAYDRELLACVQGIRHFRFMLEGRRPTGATSSWSSTGSRRRVWRPTQRSASLASPSWTSWATASPPAASSRSPGGSRPSRTTQLPPTSRSCRTSWE